MAVLTGAVAATAAIGVVYWARSVLIPIALAILLSFILAPIVTRLHRRGLPRVLAVVAVVGFTLTIVLGVGALLSRQVIQLAGTLPDRREAIKEKIASAKGWIAGGGSNRFGELIDEVEAVIAPAPQEDVVVVKQAATPIAGHIEKYLSPAVEALGQAAFTGILTIFILLRREDLRNRAIRLIGDGRIMATTKAVDDASNRISRYLLTQMVINAAFGTLVFFGLLVMRVEYALLWGALGGMLRYVPYIGTWIGICLPLAFSVTTSTGWGQPLGVFVLYFALELACNYLEPILYGQSMGLSEVAQLVSAAVWAFLWGPIGLILSGPMTACLLVLGRHVPRFHFLVVLLGDAPPLTPATAFYQRLAARDHDEATEVANAAAALGGLDDAADQILVPALARARSDFDAGELDVTDLRYIVQSTGEIAEELAELREPAARTDNALRVLLCPARDKSEMVAATIFASTLDSARWEADVAGDEMVAGELLERVAEFHPAAVVIVTLPPGGTAHTRYLVTRLKRSFPDLKVFAARWGAEESQGGTAAAFGGVESLTETLAETRKALDDAHAILNANAPDQPRRVV